MRRDCNALQAAKMLAEAAAVDWQAGRCGESNVLRGVDAVANGDRDCESQESAEGRSMAGCLEAERFLALSGMGLVECAPRWNWAAKWRGEMLFVTEVWSHRLRDFDATRGSAKGTR